MKTVITGIERICEAGELIRNGELVAFPTETVYGLGASAYDEKAIDKIFLAKGRPTDNPLIVHIASAEDAESIAYVTEEARMLFKTFSPGPLTIILPKKPNISDKITAGLPSVAIRIPRHELALSLIREAGVPIVAPSANTSTRVSPTTAEIVFEDMEGKIPMILDGGQCEVGIESTVLDLSKELPTVLRPGGITIETLCEYLPKVRNHVGEVKVSASPGMKYKHYAPKVPCVLCVNSLHAREEYDRITTDGKNAVILASSGYDVGKRAYVDLGNSLSEIAKNVFKAMRDAEKVYDYIIIEKFEEKQLGFSIMNRLKKSTQGVEI